MVNGAIQPAAIFWDIENCPVPKGIEAEYVCTNIYTALKAAVSDERHVKVFAAYGNVMKIKHQIKEGCQKSGVMFIDVPSGRKEAADNAILVDLFSFALSHPPPSTVLLISGDVDFAPALHKLGQRGYTMMIAIPSGVKVSAALCSPCKCVLDWKSVARGEVPRFAHEDWHSQAHMNPFTWREVKAQSSQLTVQMNNSAVSYQMVKSFASQRHQSVSAYLPPVQFVKRIEREGAQFPINAQLRIENGNDLSKLRCSGPESCYFEVHKDVGDRSTEHVFHNVSNQIITFPSQKHEAGEISMRPVNFVQRIKESKSVHSPAETMPLTDHVYKVGTIQTGDAENLNYQENVDYSPVSEVNEQLARVHPVAEMNDPVSIPHSEANEQPAQVHPVANVKDPVSNQMVKDAARKSGTVSLPLQRAIQAMKEKRRKEKEERRKEQDRQLSVKKKVSKKKRAKKAESMEKGDRQRQALQDMIHHCVSIGILDDRKSIQVAKDLRDSQSLAVAEVKPEYAPWRSAPTGVLTNPPHGLERQGIYLRNWPKPDPSVPIGTSFASAGHPRPVEHLHPRSYNVRHAPNLTPNVWDHQYFRNPSPDNIHYFPQVHNVNNDNHSHPF